MINLKYENPFRGVEYSFNRNALDEAKATCRWVEARHELAQWLGHNPHRTEVTYAYVPKT